MSTAISCYPVTDSLVEWMSENFVPTEESTFYYWKHLRHLVKIVDAAAEGRVFKGAASDAVRQYNARHNTNLTVQEIADREDYSFSMEGSICIFLEDMDDQETILLSEHTDINEALYLAPPEVRWALLWDVQGGEVIVYRSPHQESRQIDSESWLCDVVHGIGRGDRLAYVLPGDVEGSIRQDLMDNGEDYDQNPLSIDMGEDHADARL